MKIAVLSDIHSNSIALKACLDEAIGCGVDRIIFLGDYLSDCAYPKRTLKLLADVANTLPCYFIKGNREEYLIDYHYTSDKNWCYCSSSGSLLYTYEEITARDIEWFESLNICDTIRIEGYADITACHGSLTNTREHMRPSSQTTKQYMDNADTQYLLCGHTHLQFEYKYNGKTLINPGAVGVQCSEQTKAQFVVLSWSQDRWVCTFKSVDYDINAVIAEIKQSGLLKKSNVWARGVIKNITTGHNYMLDCFKLALAEYEQSDGYIKGARVPECYWEKAAKALDL